MGAATAWQLARRGRRVVLVDRFEAGHTRGASHGASRIYRQAYASARYSRLAADALPLWRELEAETGAGLLTITGGVDHGDPVAVAQSAAVLAEHDVRHEWLDPDRAALMWPGMRFAGPVLHQPDRAGRINADLAVAAFTAAARSHGAQIRRPLTVTGIDVDGADLVRVRTSEGAISARRVVIAAGAWTTRLLDGLVAHPPLRVTQEQPAYFPFRDALPCVARAEDWPSFIHHVGDGGVYGLTDPCGEVKVGLHGTGPECDPDRRTFAPEPDGLQRLQDYVATWLPGLDAGRPTPVSCTYTSTPDAEFVVERSGPVVVGAGFSGHGFKHAPAVGQILADLATDRTAAEVGA
ncbi:MAG: sarcosine oxidase [Pseudonocardiales bacterium]|nr:sarcosine oxidase [Pseudonocardiales bacterium]